ncbi:serine/threonine-protein kinase [Bodo saltans virus]|uniref:Serine/threonine-protein kinase n=1 Tax=Bodo saltans virus TaxID=2024608 RepID=A0A2H4UV01_9VIRU|nr:serine/threonine-protein kinase [Bodo saltans virus]ATZ80753.1 serine/threonine-protein kinase [Bodo saltans virus]
MKKRNNNLSLYIDPAPSMSTPQKKSSILIPPLNPPPKFSLPPKFAPLQNIQLKQSPMSNLEPSPMSNLEPSPSSNLKPSSSTNFKSKTRFAHLSPTLTLSQQLKPAQEQENEIYFDRCKISKNVKLEQQELLLMENAEQFKFDFDNNTGIFKNKNYTITKPEKDTYIGHGTFGEVHLGNMLNNKTNETTKVVIKTSHNDEHRSFCNETNLMPLLTHKNIAKYYGFYKDEFSYVLFYEYISNTNLRQYVEKNTPSFNQKIKIMIQLIDGLKYLHKNNAYHGDIKLDNIMIYTVRHNDYFDIVPVYIDFGLSCKDGDLCYNEPTFTRNYASIQLAKYKNDDKIHNMNRKQFIYMMKMNDIWALGVTLLRLFTKYNLNISSFTESHTIKDYIREKFAELRKLKYPADVLAYVSIIISSMLEYDEQNVYAQYRVLLMNEYIRNFFNDEELIKKLDEIDNER